MVISHIFAGISLEGKNLSTLNQDFIKSIWENQVLKLFLWALDAKDHSQKVQLQWTPSKCQRYRVDWWSNQKFFNHYQHVKII